MVYKPEWYDIVWNIGIDGKEQSKMFPPEQKDKANLFYREKVSEISKTLGSDVIMYLTHTNKLYDIICKAIYNRNGELIECVFIKDK